MAKLTIRQMAAVKRSIKTISGLVDKKNRLASKISVLNHEYEKLVKQIDAYEAGTKAITGGYTSEMLLKKVVEPTGKKDAKGRELKVVKYVPSSICVPVMDGDKVKGYFIADEATQGVGATCSEAVALVNGFQEFREESEEPIDAGMAGMQAEFLDPLSDSEDVDAYEDRAEVEMIEEPAEEASFNPTEYSEPAEEVEEGFNPFNI